MMPASPMMGARSISNQGLPSAPQQYVDIQTRQNAIIDTRTYQPGVEDIRTVSPNGVSDTYIPVTVQKDTYSAGQIVTDNYVPIGGTTPPVPMYAAPQPMTYSAPPIPQPVMPA